jgi:hypothetical protein
VYVYCLSERYIFIDFVLIYRFIDGVIDNAEHMNLFLTKRYLNNKFRQKYENYIFSPFFNIFSHVSGCLYRFVREMYGVYMLSGKQLFE